jgi:hypothetical protein
MNTTSSTGLTESENGHKEVIKYEYNSRGSEKDERRRCSGSTSLIIATRPRASSAEFTLSTLGVGRTRDPRASIGKGAHGRGGIAFSGATKVVELTATANSAEGRWHA